MAQQAFQVLFVAGRFKLLPRCSRRNILIFLGDISSCCRAEAEIEDWATSLLRHVQRWHEARELESQQMVVTIPGVVSGGVQDRTRKPQPRPRYVFSSSYVLHDASL